MDEIQTTLNLYNERLFFLISNYASHKSIATLYAALKALIYG